MKLKGKKTGPYTTELDTTIITNKIRDETQEGNYIHTAPTSIIERQQPPTLHLVHTSTTELQ
jgi:hypothetical protein